MLIIQATFGMAIFLSINLTNNQLYVRESLILWVIPYNVVIYAKSFCLKSTPQSSSIVTVSQIALVTLLIYSFLGFEVEI